MYFLAVPTHAVLNNNGAHTSVRIQKLGPGLRLRHPGSFGIEIGSGAEGGKRFEERIGAKRENRSALARHPSPYSDPFTRVSASIRISIRI